MLVQLVDILNSGVARNFQWGVERRGAEGAEIERRRRENRGAEEGGVWGGGTPSPLGVGSGEGANLGTQKIFGFFISKR